MGKTGYSKEELNARYYQGFADGVKEIEAKYRDLEEQGLLLRLPTEAYFIKDNIAPQLAECLEELKEIKSNGRYVQGNKAGQKIGYRNAIDDLSNKICMHFADWKYSEDDKCIKNIIELASESVEEIAEQLKEGGKYEM